MKKLLSRLNYAIVINGINASMFPSQAKETTFITHTFRVLKMLGAL